MTPISSKSALIEVLNAKVTSFNNSLFYDAVSSLVQKFVKNGENKLGNFWVILEFVFIWFKTKVNYLNFESLFNVLI